MINDKSSLILSLCEDYSKRVHQEDGSLVLNSIDILSINGIVINSLSYSERRAALVGLTKTMLHRGYNTVIGNDQLQLWKSTGKLLLKPPSLYFNESNREPLNINDTIMRKLFYSVLKLATFEWETIQTQQSSWWSPRPDNFLIGLYLVFPLLEFVVKRSVSEYINSDGKVISYFKAYNREYNVGNTCSIVKHMLILLENICSKELDNDLNLIYRHIEYVDHEKHKKNALDIINDKWRNPTIHGQTSISSVFGAVFNITLLIALDYVRDRLTSN